MSSRGGNGGRRLGIIPPPPCSIGYIFRRKYIGSLGTQDDDHSNDHDNNDDILTRATDSCLGRTPPGGTMGTEPWSDCGKSTPPPQISMSKDYAMVTCLYLRCRLIHQGGGGLEGSDGQSGRVSSREHGRWRRS